ncbi:MAG: sigma-54 dependent transcriptional regulator [Proteobacteria bacterium]|nr:sigma-54 dependent transcriptional regulator [Pseudomonadota bacterium]
MTQLMTHTVLIIDDEANMLDMLAASLRKAGYAVVTVQNGLQGIELVEKSTFDCILCDLKMPVMDGLQFLEEIKTRKIEASVIMMSAFATIDTAVQAMKIGAYDFITKPFKIDEILCILDKATERMQLKKENCHLRQKVKELEKERGFVEIIGESRALTEILALAKRVAVHETSVLITGESGTGKELFARGLHLLSSRSAGPFVSINCGAIPENLLESEFFGYTKGAFTGADSDRKGLFEAASAGTLFLDEIGELPLGLQVKLLRVLEEREIRPLGAGKTKKVNVRVLAATAKNLVNEVTEGRFRQDLLFRINVVELKIPPLRDRLGDIPILVKAFLASEGGRMNVQIQGIASSALALLGSYAWPGNVRELKNVLEHAIIYAENGWIGTDSLPKYMHRADLEVPANVLSDIFSIKEGKAFLEKYLIEKALLKTNGNRSQAADLLEMSYPSLLGKIKEYWIVLPEKQDNNQG